MDASGTPFGVLLMAGFRHDSTQVEALLEQLAFVRIFADRCMRIEQQPHSIYSVKSFSGASKSSRMMMRPRAPSLTATLRWHDRDELHGVLIIARDHHALATHGGVHQLRQMRLGLFRGNFSHRSILRANYPSAAVLDYSMRISTPRIRQFL